MLVPGLLFVPWLAVQNPNPPITTLVSSYPYGEQLSCETTPDGRRTFVAEGAVITVLNTTVAGAVTKINQIPVPDCQPLAQRYYHTPSGDDFLFIAGGSEGLWRITLCPGLFAYGTVQPCLADSFNPTLLDEVADKGGSNPTRERKRCVAVAVLDAPDGFNTPVLLALFAASSDPGASELATPAQKPTELRAYPVTGASGPLTPIATYVFPPTPSYAGTQAEVGTSLATDNQNPAGHNLVYVGMGKGGIWRLVLSAPSSFSADHFLDFHVPTPPVQQDSVRDISIARATISGGDKSFLYAALNWGNIVEYELTDPPALPTLKQILPIASGYPIRVSATTDGGANVRIAVALDEQNEIASESGAPSTANGVWTGLCLTVGITDTATPPLVAGGKVLCFERDTSVSSSTLSLALTVQDVRNLWGSLILRRGTTSSNYRLFACTARNATMISDLTWPNVTGTTTYSGTGMTAQFPTVSSVNPEIVLFAWEPITQYSAFTPLANSAHIDLTPPYAITPILDVAQCNPPPPLPDCTDCGLTGLGSWGGSILGEAHWIDPVDPNHEYFFPLAKMMERKFIDPDVDCTCNPMPECTLPWDPCDPSVTPYWYVAAPPGSGGVVVGWRLVHADLPSSGMPTGSSMHLKWQQIAAPRGAQDDMFSFGNDLGLSIADLRAGAGGHPAAIYGIRSGSESGLKVFQPDQIAHFSACPVPPPPADPDLAYGYGETIQTMEPPAAVAFANAWQAMTHNELEDPVPGDPVNHPPCSIHVDCGTPGLNNNTFKHVLYNTGCDFFSLRRSNGSTAYVLAVAAGYPTSGPYQGQTSPCAWTMYYGLPMVVLFDVTRTGSSTFGKPKLLQIALGQEQGHAFAVGTRSYTGESGTKVYAFVGDIDGRLNIFDVSEGALFPAASGPPYNNGVNVPLRPLCTVSFPKDPYDGYRPNVISLAINGDYLYCALARGGVGIVDISEQPTSSTPPPIVAVLDTPGLDLGLTFRTFTAGQQSVTQMIVGDSRCGIRVYQ